MYHEYLDTVPGSRQFAGSCCQISRCARSDWAQKMGRNGHRKWIWPWIRPGGSPWRGAWHKPHNLATSLASQSIESTMAMEALSIDNVVTKDGIMAVIGAGKEDDTALSFVYTSSSKLTKGLRSGGCQPSQACAPEIESLVPAAARAPAGSHAPSLPPLLPLVWRCTLPKPQRLPATGLAACASATGARVPGWQSCSATRPSTHSAHARRGSRAPAAPAVTVRICADVSLPLGHSLVVDEPETMPGGGNAGTNPLDLMCASLGTCQEITYKMSVDPPPSSAHHFI